MNYESPVTRIGIFRVVNAAIVSAGKFASAMVIASPCPILARAYSNSGVTLEGTWKRGIATATKSGHSNNCTHE